MLCCTGCIPDYISTYAGYGKQAFIGDNSPATSAGLLYPTGITLGANQSLYIADSGQHRWVVLQRSKRQRLACEWLRWQASQLLLCPAQSALLLTHASALAALLLPTQHRIRHVDAATGLISTVAGIGTGGSTGDGGPAVAAQLNTPTAIAFDAQGNMFIAEALGNRIRRYAFCPV